MISLKTKLWMGFFYLVMVSCQSSKIIAAEVLRSSPSVKAWETAQKEVSTMQACQRWEALSQDKDFGLSLWALEAYHYFCLKIYPLKDLKKSPWILSLAEKNPDNSLSFLELRAQFGDTPQKKEEALVKLIKMEPKNPQWQESLKKLSPRLFPDELPLARARDHREHLEYKEALSLFEEALKVAKSSLEQHQILNEIRITQKLMNQRLNAVRTAGKAYGVLTVYDETKLQALMTWTRALWTESLGPDALKILTKEEVHFSGRARAELWTLMARIYEQLKDQKNRDKYFGLSRDFLRALSPIQDLELLTERTLWWWGWSFYKEGKFEKSQELWQEFADRSLEESSRIRSRFWLAQLGDESKKPAEFSSIAADDPLGFYGMIASQMLGQSQRPSLGKPSEGEIFDRVKKVVPESAWMERMWARVLDEGVILQILLRQDQGRLNSLESRDQVIYRAFLGDYLPLFAELRKLSPEERKDWINKYGELIFPHLDQRYPDLQPRVEWPLVHSIIRQESAFNPIARSPADALGLMQMLPKLAATRAQSISLEWKGPWELFDPRKNILVGSEELRSLLEENKNDLILSAASYNANPATVKMWKKRSPNLSPLEFIEDIPYDETRNYVKLVLRNLWFYGGETIPIHDSF